MTTEELKAWAENWTTVCDDTGPEPPELAAAVLALIAERDAAQDGMRQFVERAAKERTRAEAAEGKLAEMERVFADAEALAATVLDKRVAAAEAKLAEAERERDEVQAAMDGQARIYALAVAKAARLEALREALRGLVRRLDEIHADGRYKAVWEISQLHVGPYIGPTYVEALNAARAALAAGRNEPR